MEIQDKIFGVILSGVSSEINGDALCKEFKNSFAKKYNGIKLLEESLKDRITNRFVTK